MDEGISFLNERMSQNFVSCGCGPLERGTGQTYSKFTRCLNSDSRSMQSAGERRISVKIDHSSPGTQSSIFSGVGKRGIRGVPPPFNDDCMIKKCSKYFLF